MADFNSRAECKPDVTLSVVITGFDSHRSFLNTLTGLAVAIAKHPLIAVEVIVVDNGSTPPLRTVIAARDFPVSIDWVYRTAAPLNFRPGSARNIGIATSKGEFILLLDGDCIPAPGCLRGHLEALRNSTSPLVTLSHRIFIDGRDVTPHFIREHGGVLDRLPEILSTSNYGLPRDRRMEEFQSLDRHPMPFNCCHGCNIGIRRADLTNCGLFDEEFDGYWGYEDIEFGHRMWRAGCKFVYLPMSYVYHQEGTNPSMCAAEIAQMRRNYKLACSKIPGFSDFRDCLDRAYYRAV